MLALSCAIHHPRQPLLYYPGTDCSGLAPVDVYTTAVVFVTIPLRDGDVHYVRSLRSLRTNTPDMVTHIVELGPKCRVPAASVMRSLRIAWK